MASAFFLFTGENLYALREEKRKWMHEFAAKHGAENLLVLDGATAEFRALLDEISIAPFIAAKRLVVVNGMPKFAKEEVEQLAREMHPATILVICDPKPDKRLGGTKTLMSVATVKTFDPVTGAPLAEWIRGSLAANGKTISPPALTALLQRVGEDQDMLWQETQKLSLGTQADAVDVADVERLTVPSAEQEVWALTNMLAAGKRDDALLYARSLIERGEDAYGVWSILLWMLKNTVATVAAVEEGQRNPAKLASDYGVPFPSAKSLLTFAQRIKRPALEQFLDWAADADIQLKTGGYRSTQEFPQEVQALVDRFIVGYATLRG